MKKYLILFLLIASAASAILASPNIMPTFELRQRGNSANNLIIRNDSLIGTNCAVSLQNIVKALDKVVTDTIQGSGTIVGIGSDTIRFDYDSSGTVAVMTFGGYGGGIRWNRATDAMQYTNDFSTWTDIGTGGTSSTNADSLFGVIAYVRPTTDGYVLKYDADGDSLYLAVDATGANADSNAIIYETDRVGMYTDTGLYLGDVGDSTMLWYDLTSDNIKAYVTIFYGDDVADSAVATWGRITAAIGDSVSGLITGINSANGITGGASQGVATLQLDGSAFYVGGDTVRIFNNNAGRLILNVFGTPSDINEFVIAENAITFGSGVIVSGLTNTSLTIADGYREVATADSAYPTVNRVNALIAASPAGDVESVALGNGGSGDGTSGAITLNVVAGTSTGLAVNADSVYITTVPDAFIATTLTRDTEASGLAHDTLWANTPGFATKANVHDSLFANTPGYATKANVHDSVYAPGFATKANVHDTMFANTPGYSTKVDVHDSLFANTPGYATKGNVHDSVYAPGFATKVNVHDSIWANTPGFATKVNVHDSLFANTPAFLTRAELKDSINATKTHSGIWTLSGNWVNTTNPWADNEVANNLTVDDAGIATTLMRDSEFTDSVNAARIHSGIWTISGNWVNTANPWADNEVADDITAGFADSTGKTTHGSINLWDLATGSVDSTKIVDGSIGSGDIGTGRITTTHVLDNTLAAADIATGGVATAEILDNTIAAGDVDTTISLVIGNLRTRARNDGVIKSNNFQVTDAESTLKIGGAQGLIIGANITFGTDIEDDSLVEIFIPEEWPAVLVRGFSTADIAYNDSITIRGVTDSTQGNAIRFNDSTLTSGNHRRHMQLEVDVPPDCDSLRRVIIKCKSGSYTATTTEFFTVARLARRSFAWSLIDSAIGGSLLDKDSSAAASATDITLASNWAVTQHNSLYLLLSGRRDAGTVYNYADVYEVRFIWHRTGL